MPSKKTKKHNKNRDNKTKQSTSSGIPLVVQNNYTNQQIIMAMILAACYVYYLEERRSEIVSDKTKNKLETEMLKFTDICKNASFSEIDFDLNSKHKNCSSTEHHYSIKLVAYERFVQNDNNNTIENQQKFDFNPQGSIEGVVSNIQELIHVGNMNFQGPIQVGSSFRFDPSA